MSLSGFIDRRGSAADETGASDGCPRLIYLRCEFCSVVMVSVETTGEGVVVVVCSDVVVWL